MSAAERVEWDRLADYAAGTLTDASTAAEVARLVATDPAWAQAYATLTDAEPMIRDELAALGAEPARMPADVVVRLDAAFAHATSEHAAKQPHAHPPEHPRTTVVSLATRRRRRRWPAGAGIAAVAAGVVAFGVFGLPALPGMRAEQPAGTTAGAPADNTGRADQRESLAGPSSTQHGPAAPNQGGVGELATVTVLTSGRDYQRSNLASEVPGRAGVTGQTAPPEPTKSAARPVELTRLAEPGALRDCLAAITAAFGGTALSVDFARFEGVAALIVRLSAPNQVVVAGPACGLPAAGADARYRVAVN